MNKGDMIGTLIMIVVLISMATFVMSSSIKTLKYCEGKNWDGSEYHTGVYEKNLFKENQEIIVKCNKDPSGETDVMIDTLDALPFIKIKTETKQEANNGN